MVWMHHGVFDCSPIERHFGGFLFFAITACCGHDVQVTVMDRSFHLLENKRPGVQLMRWMASVYLIC